MAKVAHLILAHQYPEAVSRLTDSLAHANADTYIHVDKKVPITPFIHSIRPLQNSYLITKRNKITWGAFSMISATLNAMEEILSNNKPYDFINLLSEADYPLSTAEEIHRFLDIHGGKSFMEMHFDGSPWWEEAQQKITKYHFVNYDLPGKYLLEELVNSITPLRQLPNQMTFTGRSQWLTLSVNHVKYILSYTANNPQVIRFFKHTWGPDEFFFQTILYNSPYRNELINDNLRYIDWTEKKMSPKTLTTDDFEALKKSKKFYARKFDARIDSDILDLIDQRLLVR